MLGALAILEELLRRHKHYGQADVVERLRVLYPDNTAAFVILCQSVDIWGGAGAVWDCAGFGADEGAFRKAVIRLTDEMESLGIGTDRSRFIASVFHRWKTAQ